MKRFLLVGLLATIATDATAGPLKRLFGRRNESCSQNLAPATFVHHSIPHMSGGCDSCSISTPSMLPTQLQLPVTQQSNWTLNQQQFGSDQNIPMNKPVILTRLPDGTISVKLWEPENRALELK